MKITIKEDKAIRTINTFYRGIMVVQDGYDLFTTCRYDTEEEARDDAIKSCGLCLGVVKFEEE